MKIYEKKLESGVPGEQNKWNVRLERRHRDETAGPRQISNSTEYIIRLMFSQKDSNLTTY